MTDAVTEDCQNMTTQITRGGAVESPEPETADALGGTIPAVVAHGHWEELAMHLRAATSGGLCRDETMEVLLQTARHFGMPSANTIFRTLQQVFREMDSTS